MKKNQSKIVSTHIFACFVHKLLFKWTHFNRYILSFINDVQPILSTANSKRERKREKKDNNSGIDGFKIWCSVYNLLD